ncbi:MAG: bifunctional proline dehydrogenase/L-glutamate gamma-semialdehyde dehydrogenase PutA [Paracoccaceae bacterium]
MTLSPWQIISTKSLMDETEALENLVALAGLSEKARTDIKAGAKDLVMAIRAHKSPSMMDVFLAEYGLSNPEGIALMCLAEALLRVPDDATMTALIEDKIAPSDWGQHLGKSASSLVNSSTWALMLTGRVLGDKSISLAGHLHKIVKRLGEPVIRLAVARAMKEMGRQFVLGETIPKALTRAAKREALGFFYSYDMLGEAAKTDEDALHYFTVYKNAIEAISGVAKSNDCWKNPGISVKLSALHPRYETAHSKRVLAELAPRLLILAQMAKVANLGLNVDAEEADRLGLSLQIIEQVFADPSLAWWSGFGVVVQAYSRRAPAVIDWLYALAEKHNRKMMVRLVKGAYWDTEVKRAQVLGLVSFPVFTRKVATDVSYIANARKLLTMRDRIYPQFATHNAHSVAAILSMAAPDQRFEFQRLHGMGEVLHDIVHTRHKRPCRIYAPVGAHRDLLAYLVRRLLENGANSSFVNQIIDQSQPVEVVAACPFDGVKAKGTGPNPVLLTGGTLFGVRKNALGFDLADYGDLVLIDEARSPCRYHIFKPDFSKDQEKSHSVLNPATLAPIGQINWANQSMIDMAISGAQTWDAPGPERAAILLKVADLFENGFGQIFALLTREAGKTLPDALGELREAIDFLRYYAGQISELTAPPIGIFAAISPWNFPLAIFTGQIAAALAAGNGVLAKAAPQTPLIARHATALFHRAGVPENALQLLLGGAEVGSMITRDPRIRGVVFTGSTRTAQTIGRVMAKHLDPSAPLIAETGGINAMIIDSTALPEQAVRDIVTSAFQSAGQRCSALRCLYVQEDVAPAFTKMLYGAMDALTMGDPWDLSTDIGPVVDQAAQSALAAQVQIARDQGRLLYEIPCPKNGCFIAPSVISVKGISDITKEIFGPILHLATFKVAELPKIISDINSCGYGLTFGLHSRIDDRVQYVISNLKMGNIYINRNQIGAVVESQPFGGEGLSGTGPKAGGPLYLSRFCQNQNVTTLVSPVTAAANVGVLQKAIYVALAARGVKAMSWADMCGPTGESNRLYRFERDPILCLGPSLVGAKTQLAAITALGGSGVLAHDLDPKELALLQGYGGAVFWGQSSQSRAYLQVLRASEGPILRLITGAPIFADVVFERHVCVDTTAAGGNAQLLLEAGNINASNEGVI